jgi:GH35 family endo-1,4-beta-xylanase
LARIEQIRKGDLNILVTNAAGKPLAGVPVKVRMTRHAFTFGTAITANMLTRMEPDAVRYREVFLQHFNKAVFENDLKWPAWQDTSRRGVVLQAVDWLREQRIPIRGHVMVWPSWHNLPQNIGALRDRPNELRKAIEDHIRDQTQTLRGRIQEWDVINESYAHNDAIKLLGREVMADWFKIAHEGDPAVKLFYNDYIMFWGEGPGSPSQYFYDTVQFLKDRGAPIHGIGEQGHFGGNPANPASVLATFDRFGRLGIPIQISEFDIDTSDQEVKNAYTRDFMIAAFSHPAVTGVMMWGFWEGRHWKPRAALWNRDWSLRPHGRVWVDLLKKQWWTNVEGRTDASGNYQLRGYCGEYEVGPGGGPVARVTLANGGADVQLRGE